MFMYLCYEENRHELVWENGAIAALCALDSKHEAVKWALSRVKQGKLNGYLVDTESSKPSFERFEKELTDGDCVYVTMFNGHQENWDVSYDVIVMKVKVSDDADQTHAVTEVCPHCENEIEMRWNTGVLGHKAFCPVCGNRLMLCDECQHTDEPRSCNYSSETDTCRLNTQMPKSDLRIETPLGAIIARKTSDPAHPGVWIDLRRADADSDMPLVLVEFSDDDFSFSEGEMHVVTRVWGDVKEEEYTTKVVHDGVEDFFRTEEGV